MKKKKIFKIIVAIILVIASIGFISMLFNKVSDFSIRSVNEDNLISVDDYEIENIKDGNIQVSIDKYGRIDFKGENKSDQAVYFDICQIILQKGEYHISSGAKGCGEKTYRLVLENEDGDVINADNEFIVTGTTTYTVSVVVEANQKIDAKFSPVLVEGDEPGNFFVWFK